MTRFQEYAANPEVPFFVWLRFLTHQRLTALARHHLGVEARDPRREVRIVGASSPSVTSAALAEQLLGKHTAPSLAAHRAEQKRIVEEALTSMNETDRDVLALRHFEQLSNLEAAPELGMEESATSKRYIRALKKLKTILAGMPGAPGAPGGTVS